MTPDVDSRVAAIEKEQVRTAEKFAALAVTVAQHGEKVAGLEITVRALASLPVQYATMHAIIDGLVDDLREIKQTLAERDQQATRDRKEIRVALIGLIGVIFAALITGVFAYLAASGGGP